MTQQDLTLFNSFSGRKETFVPADPERVTMYVCGPTVYSYAHIGNARPAVVFDVLFRVLREIYGEDHVLYGRNFTDIDDRIIKASQEKGVPINEITDKFAAIYMEDTGALGVLPPTFQPRATAHIEDMQALVSELLRRGHAYAAEGHVLFSVKSFPDYGRLSKLNRDDIIAGARVEIAPYKQSPEDFVLWKPSTEDEPGWHAPADWGIEGRGRPGWHLECSAMIEAVLGTPIDIHGGGQDLRFPHHENEIAQSCCSTEIGGVPLARYWVHNGFLTMGEDKMSKSLGNVVLPRDLLKSWEGEAIRWALLSAQYRQPLMWTYDLLTQSKRQLDRFYRVLKDIPGEASQKAPDTVMSALCDDLNTPGAMAALHALRDDAAKGDADAAAELRAAGRVLGLFAADPAEWLKGKAAEGALSDDAITALVAERDTARAAKNFARSDEIRDQLAAEGILIEDAPGGATWRRG